jgi:hypothetical protein
LKNLCDQKFHHQIAPPTPCTKQCSSGFLDDVGCECCVFVEYPKYLELKQQLAEVIANYESSTTGDESIEAKIASVEEKLKEVNEYVIANCGNPSSVEINAKFSFVQTELKKLQIEVVAFKDSLVYNSSCDSKTACPASRPTRKYTDCSCFCGVKCNATNDFITLRASCDCDYIEGYFEFFSQRSIIQQLITKVQYSFHDVETKTLVLKELTDLNTEWNRGNSGLESNRTTDIQKQTIMEEFIDSVREVIESAESYISETPCGTTCVRPRVYRQPDCVCYTTKPIADFFRTYQLFVSLEAAIRSYNYRGNTTNQKTYNEWADKVKEEGLAFYEAVTKTTFTAAAQQILYDNFLKSYEDLKAAWTAFTGGVRTTTTKCNVQCSGDSVKNCEKCSCTPIQDFSKLDTILAGIPDLLTSIEALTSNEIEAAGKNTLRDNANAILTGINNLKKYVTDYCGNLDEKFVNLRCAELNGWDLKLRSDLYTIKNTSAVTVCATTCPNSRWTYDASACRCDCSITGCSIPSQALDPYNCMCATKSNCTLTTASCTGSTPLLDYSNCACKKKP